MTLDTIRQDLRYTARSLRRDAGFFGAAILIIAIGIGANTAIFSLVHGLLYRPLPFPQQERLVWIANTGGGGTGLSSVTSRVSTFLEWKKNTRLFEDLTAYFAFFDYGSYTMVGVGEPERLIGVGVAQNFLDFAGVKPALGRNFTEAECLDDVPLALMLTHGLWKSRFGADPNIVGRELNLNGKPASVVGVLPADFDFATVFVPGSRVDMLIPFPLTQAKDRWGNTLAVIGRLKPGATIKAAQAEFEAINEGLRRAEPQRWTFGAKLTALREHMTGRLRNGLLLLLSAVGGVLLIACTNLSNLLLVRATARRKEAAIRSALGASRARLIGQMLTESMVLAGCGALAGIALAWVTVRWVASIDSVSMPLLRTVTLDGTALLFTVGLTLVTGLLFGSVPAIQAARAKEAETLKDSSRGMSSGRHTGWTRNALVVSEVALACVLLVGAGLLIRSFLRVLDVDLGFQPEHAMAWRISAGQQRDTALAQSAFYDQIAQRVQAMPGVVAVGVTDSLPLSRDRSWSLGAKGVTYPKDQYPIAHPRIIDAGYLKAMGIAVRDGRGFEPADRKDSEAVILINEKAARRLFPDRSAVGQMVRFDRERRVAGVVANVRHLSIEEEGGMEAYIPVTQSGSSTVDMVVRSTLPRDVLIPSIRRVLREMETSMAVGEVQPIGDLVDRAVSPRRFLTSLLGAFATAALALAAIGIYGVISFGVNQRRQETGIRMALGASPATVQRQILRETVTLVSAGVAIGVIAALALSRFAASLLYQLETTDALTFGGTVCVLILVALVAGYLPARRASRLDPMTVLRAD